MGPIPFLNPLHKKSTRVQRPAVRRAEGDEHLRVAPSVEHLEVVPGDEAAHRMADEHELGGAVAGPLAPVPAASPAPARRDGGRRRDCRGASRTGSRTSSARRRRRTWRGSTCGCASSRRCSTARGSGGDPGIRRGAVTPSPRSSTDGSSPSSSRSLTLRPSDTMRAPRGTRRHCPDIASVALQHAAEDPRQQHDNIAHRLLRRHGAPLDTVSLSLIAALSALIREPSITSHE